MRGPRLGSIIGAVGGLLFILINAGGLDSPLDAVARISGLVAFAVVLIVVLRRPARDGSAPGGDDAGSGRRPSAGAVRTYAISVVAMVLAIPLGANLIVLGFRQPLLVLPWVVLVVGVHFLPFAAAFGAPVFVRLGAALIAVAIVGALLGLAGFSSGPALTGVAAGAVLLWFSASGPARRAVP